MTTTRPITLLIGMVMFVLYSLFGLVTSIGMAGQPLAGDGPPAVVIYGGIALGILGLVAALGVWLGHKWGFVLAVIVLLLNILSAAPGIFFAPDSALRLLALFGVVAGIVILALLLLPGSRRVSV